ncbi:MAG TPA: S-layer homology domain-containing protein [Chloroflexia bacterium]|nr:S-layer homology domain-containing protein [Chloroflexia bacterium]
MKRSFSTLAVLVRHARASFGSPALLKGQSKRVALAALMLLLVVVVGASGYLRSAQPTSPQGTAGGQLMNLPSGVSGSSGAPYDPPTERTLPNGGKTSSAVRHDVSAPLRAIKPIPPAPVAEDRENGVENSLPPMGPAEPVQDPVVQDFFGPLAMPAPIQSIEGQYNYWGVSPPDTDGDVGPNHYVQMVNLGFQIYDKSGNVLYGPADTNTIWSGFGGECETQNAGDPIVLYDQMADRWLLSQFTAAIDPPDPAIPVGTGPYFECIAISTSPDPTGSYYRYAFQVSETSFEDYPHLGVWPDGYYMTANEFVASTGNTGAGIFAFERDKMLAGQQADMIYFALGLPYGGLLPSDLEGYTQPPENSPNFILGLQRQTANQLHMFKFDVVTWDPPSANLHGPFVIPVATWDASLCTAARGACVPQPSPGLALESMSDRLMHRLVYRNFTTHESLVANHTVDFSGRAGIRWYEIRNPNTITPTVHQQSTYSPDALHRWMGSLAMDRLGNIAIGYSVSSTSTVFPSIRYAGRLATDPLNQLAQGEAELIAGSGVQTGSARWGDYSSMHVDADECTFWYTTEYYDQTSFNGWKTRIGSFRFPNCTPLCGVTDIQTGSITMSDTTQVSAVVGGRASECNDPQACPGMSSFANPRHTDVFTYTNSSGSTQCVTVSLDSTACGNGGVGSVAYLTSFNPSSVCSNYLASAPAGPNSTYSFQVPAGATYVVVVRETNIDEGCASYTLRVNPSCGVVPEGDGTPSPTLTAVPPTVTSTMTSTQTSTVVPSSTSTVAATGTVTNTAVAASATATRTNTAVATGSATSTRTATSVPAATATACPIEFADVQPADTFYEFIRCLACRAIVGGYPCGAPGEPCNEAGEPYYRPSANVTRGQLSKIIANSAGLNDPIAEGQQQFADVEPDDPFYPYVERLAQTGAIAGYPCGGPGVTEPCDSEGRPYFRPNNPATRGQISKIVAIAAGFEEDIPDDQETFTDVPTDSPFWVYIERLARRGIISGYGEAEKCPTGTPCFLYNDLTTRGQMAKIAANAFFPNCDTPARR